MSNFRNFLEEIFKETKSFDRPTLFDELRIKIKEVRINKGITQRELSEATGITQANISNFEKGKYNMTLKQIEKILSALNISIRLEVIDNE